MGHQHAVLREVVLIITKACSTVLPSGVSGLQVGGLVRVLQEIGHHIPLLGALQPERRQLAQGQGDSLGAGSLSFHPLARYAPWTALGWVRQPESAVLCQEFD